jgi:putative transposase
MSREVHVRFRESLQVKLLRATRLCEGVAARYALIKEMRLKYPIPLLSRMLGISASGYYAWVDRPLSQWAQEERRLEIEIKAAHKRTRQSYGAERLQHDLAEHGIRVGVCRIKRIRKKLGLCCKQKRKFKITTDSRHKLPVAENLLGQKFQAYKPNQVWVSDITYIPTDEGWLYLAGHKDLFTGEIVGYAMGERLTKNLVSESLWRAITIKHPLDGLLHHSDRGSQYCSYEYRQMLDQFGLQVSMSGIGNCFDNAPMESFWGILKQELIYHHHYRSRQEARQEITEYIEIFYNRQRIQAKLGFISPAAYTLQYYERLVAA